MNFEIDIPPSHRNDSTDKLALAIIAIKEDRDALLAAAKQAHRVLSRFSFDAHADDADNALRAAIAKAEDAQ